MRLVATLIARDEADIVGAQIAYHLSTGVDFVIATDHESQDGTTEILDAYEREGVLRRIAESGPVHEDVWRTRMARLAAVDHAADWVINTDADEFWSARRGALKELLAAVPRRFGAIGVMNRHFVPFRDDGAPFYERMTVRVSHSAPLNDPTSAWRPGAKVAHRADPSVTVFHAGYAVAGARLDVVPDWYPLDNLHFPYRTVEQWARKTTRRAFGDKSLGTYVTGHAARERGRVEEAYARIEVDEATVVRGLELGTLVRDTRVRDVLRGLADESDSRYGGFRLSKRSVDVDPAGVPADVHDDDGVDDVTALHDATLVRLQRRIDDVDRRSAILAKQSFGAPDS
jgi:glycosyl transferase family 2